MRAVSMCSGYGGLDLAVERTFQSETVAYAEVDESAAAIFSRHWPGIPNAGDLATADWSPYAGVDIVCAGFPCQDLSYAGKGRGIVKDSRSGLWYAIEHALGVLRPRYVVLENVAAIVGRRPGLDVVLAGLAGLGFDAEWTCVRASDVGAPHRRERWFCVAHRVLDSGHGAGGSQHGVEYDVAAGRVGQSGQVSPADAEGDAGRELYRDSGAASDSGGERHGGREDARVVGRLDHRDADQARQRERSRQEPGDRGATFATDPNHLGREGAVARPWHDLGSDPRPQWGDYAPAIERWESVLRRAAPAPTDDRGRLNPIFVEWMQGLPEGWVTGTPGLSRSKQLKALGNGVVPQQAVYAIRSLLQVREVAA